MPLPVTSQVSLDVLAGRDPGHGERWRRPHVCSGLWLRLLVGLALVALVGAVALRAGQDDTRSVVVDASGSMELVHQSSEPADRRRSTQMEDGNATFAGPIRVELPDRQMVGAAELHFSFAATVEDDQVWIAHAWGQVRATFDSTTCDGPFAWSFYRQPQETGGSINLRCDDGSLFAATALMEADEGASANRRYRVFITLQDGAYAAG